MTIFIDSEQSKQSKLGLKNDVFIYQRGLKTRADGASQELGHTFFLFPVCRMTK